MGVFKEHAHAFEAVAKKQSQIWNDAADYGYAFDKNNPPQDIKDLLFFVNDLKGTSLQKKRTEDPENGFVELVFRIGWEMDEGYECGTQYTISSQNIGSRSKHNLFNKDANRFINVDIQSYREWKGRR